MKLLALLVASGVALSLGTQVMAQQRVETGSVSKSVRSAPVIPQKKNEATPENLPSSSCAHLRDRHQYDLNHNVPCGTDEFWRRMEDKAAGE